MGTMKKGGEILRLKICEEVLSEVLALELTYGVIGKAWCITQQPKTEGFEGQYQKSIL